MKTRIHKVIRMKDLAGKILLIFYGALAMIAGLAMIPSIDLTPWIVPAFGMVTGIIGLTVVGLKKFTNISSIKKLGPIQWTTLFVSSLVFIVSFLMIPPIGISTGVFGTIAGVIVLIGGIPMIIEALTK